MIGVVDVIITCPYNRWVTADHHFGFKAPDFAHYFFTQHKRSFQQTIRLSQENHLRSACNPGSLPAFCLADFGCPGSGHTRFSNSYVTAGEEQITYPRPLPGPACQGAYTRKLNIIWMGKNG